MSAVPTNDEQLRAEVSARYARTALQVLGKEQPLTAADACCAPTCCTPNTAVPAESRTAFPVVAAEPAQTAACCGPSCCSTDTRDASVITSDLYSQAELGAIPMAAALASLGCGNPTALAELSPGERVLDLGSGGCIAGALEEETYRALLATAGFTNVEVEVTRRYALQDIAENGAHASVAALGEAEQRDVDGRFVSAFIRAQKPGGL